MSLTDVFGADYVAHSTQTRTEPVQQRSAARLSALLDAAAAVVDEVGFDRITTAMVAERAGASIGTVYRYYPDRVAVLQALRERAVQRYRQRIVEELTLATPQTWWEAVDCSVTAFVGLYRSEPGFRIMGFADRERGVTDLGAGNPDGNEDRLDSVSFARQLASVLVEEFGLGNGPELIFRLEVTFEMADSLLSRAFQSDPEGDERFITECRRIMHDYLAGYYGANASFNTL